MATYNLAKFLQESEQQTNRLTGATVSVDDDSSDSSQGQSAAQPSEIQAWLEIGRDSLSFTVIGTALFGVVVGTREGRAVSRPFALRLT